MQTFIKPIKHQPNKPLNIERDWRGGIEMIVIEGVTYDADYFRTFAHPDTDVLYAIRRDGEKVWLTVIRNAEDAKKFFDETLGLENPAPTEDQDGL